MFVCNLRNYLVQLLGMRNIDLTIIQRAPEMVRQLISRLPEMFLRLLGTIEAVHVPSGFDENLCERETETPSSACHDEDAAIELFDCERISDEHLGRIRCTNCSECTLTSNSRKR